MPQTLTTTGAADSRLRFVFSGAVMSFDLAANATFEDVALKLADPALRAYGKPLGIDVAWGALELAADRRH